MMKFKRKLYKRGSSFETTLPAPLLFALDPSKKYFVVFKFDSSANKWYVEFEDSGIIAKDSDSKIDDSKKDGSKISKISGSKNSDNKPDSKSAGPRTKPRKKPDKVQPTTQPDNILEEPKKEVAG